MTIELETLIAAVAFPKKTAGIAIRVTLSDPVLIESLCMECARRDLTRRALATKIIETVISDHLFAAVLDDA